LGKLHACIGRQTIAWMREQPSKRGFEGIAASVGKADIIASIAVRQWKPGRPSEAGE